MNEPRRRSLSGIFIPHQFDDEMMPEKTCFEDCPEKAQKDALDEMSPEDVKKVAIHLAKALRKVGDQFDIISV